MLPVMSVSLQPDWASVYFQGTLELRAENGGCRKRLEGGETCSHENPPPPQLDHCPPSPLGHVPSLRAQCFLSEVQG